MQELAQLDGLLGVPEEKAVQVLESFKNGCLNAHIVVPRPGTISPWSSKATDIAHISGLGFIKRIERGILYLDSPVFDRMTQQALATLPADFFAQGSPRPLKSVELLGKENVVHSRDQAIQVLKNANSEWGLRPFL